MVINLYDIVILKNKALLLVIITSSFIITISVINVIGSLVIIVIILTIIINVINNDCHLKFVLVDFLNLNLVISHNYQ